MTSSFPFKVVAIVAMDEGRAIGFENGIPWQIPEDQRRFAQLTSGQTVLMGRKTYQSLPEKFRPLPKRKNIVITRNRDHFEAPPSVAVFSSVESALKEVAEQAGLMQGEVLWIIGGGEIYAATLPLLDEIYLTQVLGTHQGDAFFPIFEDQFELVMSEDHGNYSYRNYRRRNAISGSLKNAP
jgi:dihydrofolate reductase